MAQTDIKENSASQQPRNISTASVIGLGRMGQAHIEALLQLKINIIALCDISEEKLNETSNKWNLSTTKKFKNIEDLLSDIEIADLLVISTTADSHCDIVCLASKAKTKMILCEKPLARSIQECDMIIEHCQKYGTKLAVNHQMRFIPQYVLPKQELNSGRLGNLASMNIIGGCFGISMNGSHYIEAFNFMTDSSPYEITAWFSKTDLQNPRGPDFFDKSGQMRIISKNNKRFFLEAGNDQGHGLTILYGAQYGHIFVDELEGEIISVARKEEFQSLPMTRYGSPWERLKNNFIPYNNMEATKNVLLAFFEGSNYPNEYTGRDIIRTLVAAYHSSENNNRTIYIDDPNIPYDKIFPWA